jgi:transposase
MIETALPLVPERRPALPAPDHALPKQVATLRLENAALRAENAVLHAYIRGLEAQLGQNSSNSSRPPSSDPPQVPPKRRPTCSGRKRSGQLGYRRAFYRLLPVEQVDVVGLDETGRWHSKEPQPDRSCGHRRGTVRLHWADRQQLRRRTAPAASAGRWR